MGQKWYVVDWSDNSFPSIRLHNGDPDVDKLTLTEAKKEIADYATNLIEHWRFVKSRARSVRASALADGKTIYDAQD